MAQAKIRNLNTVVSKLYGGMSVDDYIGASDSDGTPMCFYDCSGLEIRRNSKFATIADNKPTLVDMGSAGTLGDCVNVGQIDVDEQAYFYSNGKIVSPSGSVSKSTSANIQNSFQYNGYGHVIKSDGKIDRWPLLKSASKDTGVASAVSGGTYATDYANVGVPMQFPLVLIIGSLLYVFNMNKVYKMDLTVAGYPVTTALTLSAEMEIRHASYIGDRFFIYAKTRDDNSIGGNGNDSVQAMWNGGDVAVTGNLTYINWKGKAIRSGITVDNFDYIFSADSNGYYVHKAGGYQPEMLFYSPSRTYRIAGYKNSKVAMPFLYYPNINSAAGSLIYFPGKSCVYTYGTLNPSVRPSFARQFRFTGDDYPTCVVNGYAGSGNMIYAYRSNTGRAIIAKQYVAVPGVAHGLDPATVILNPIISSLYSNENGALKARVGYDLDTDTKINVYRKTDYDGGYCNFYVETNSTTVPAVGDTYTFSGVTYTVYAVTYKAGNSTNYIVHCTCPELKCELADINKLYDYGTATKTTGTGPSEFVFYRRTYGMKLIGTCDNVNSHKELFEVSESHYQITFMLDLITYDQTKTPKFWDFVYAYTDIENDI